MIQLARPTDDQFLVRSRGFRFIAPSFAAFMAISALFVSSIAAETWEVAGETYANVRVQKVTPGSVTIFHRGGVTQLELDLLPPELQQRFDFDPNKARAWRAMAEQQLAVSRKQPAQVPHEHPSSDPLRPTSAPTNQVEYRATVDLRPAYREHGLILKNQGRRPSCSVFAVVGALEYEIARRTGAVEPLSEEFLIWAVRELQPGIPIDDGFNFREVISSLQAYGVPTQAEMPNTFGKKIEEIQPPPEVIQSATQRRDVVPVWFRPDDPQLIDRIVGALNLGTPVILGVRWPHWRTLRHNSLLLDQQPLEGAGHAVTLIGYEAAESGPDGTRFLFRNSYGIDWGTGGCGYMAASYLRENIIGACYLTIPSAAMTASAHR